MAVPEKPPSGKPKIVFTADPELEAKAAAFLSDPLLAFANGSSGSVRRVFLELQISGGLALLLNLDEKIEAAAADLDFHAAVAHAKVSRRTAELRVLRYLLERIHERNDRALVEPYSSDGADVLRPQAMNAFVVSIDIRKSTTLMMKAVSPAAFAEFLERMVEAVSSLVKEFDGVVDKFTGDGILAYFPIHITGRGGPTDDLRARLSRAGEQVLNATAACHEAFASVFREHHGSFTTAGRCPGVGIGVDYGPIHLVTVAGTPTILGPAVVYACRLSTAKANETWLNVGAKEALMPLKGSVGRLGGLRPDLVEILTKIKGEDEEIHVYRHVGDRAWTPGKD